MWIYVTPVLCRGESELRAALAPSELGTPRSPIMARFRVCRMRPDSESALDVPRCRAQQAATRCFLPLFRAKPEFLLPMYDQSAPQ